jgi:hypothetical protein
MKGVMTMKDKKYAIQPVFNYSDEDLTDIISSALYDIGYWACIDNTTEDWERVLSALPSDRTCEDIMWALLQTGQSVRIEDAEGEDGPWELTLDKLLSGIKLTIQNGFWNGKLDDIDGEVGDIIFQYALFDEIIYG